LIAIAGTLVADIPAYPVRNLPEHGSVAWVEHMGLHLGGIVANTGAALHKLGIPIAAIGRVGQDMFGRVVEEELSRFADQVFLKHDPQRPTTSAMVLIHPGGERSFLASLGAGASFSAEDIPLEQLHELGVRALLLGYINHLPGLKVETLVPMLKRASGWGWLTSIDVAWDPNGTWETTRQLLSQTDIFCPNEREALALTGCAEPSEAAQKLLESGVRLAVAIKMGEQGCYALTADGLSARIPGHKVKAVDTTGAGDAFLAGMLAGWYKGFSWIEAAKIANATGALAVTGLGAAEGVQSWEAAVALSRSLPVY